MYLLNNNMRTPPPILIDPNCPGHGHDPDTVIDCEECGLDSTCNDYDGYDTDDTDYYYEFGRNKLRRYRSVKKGRKFEPDPKERYSLYEPDPKERYSLYEPDPKERYICDRKRSKKRDVAKVLAKKYSNATSINKSEALKIMSEMSARLEDYYIDTDIPIVQFQKMMESLFSKEQLCMELDELLYQD